MPEDDSVPIKNAKGEVVGYKPRAGGKGSRPTYENPTDKLRAFAAAQEDKRRREREAAKGKLKGE